VDEEDERITLELPAEEPCDLDEQEQLELLLELAPVVGYA
jgi:hypothetical protein